MTKIDKYTFCHIPKTGGITICSLIYNREPEHIVCTRENSEKFLFTFVRHPYSRCISAFQFLKNGGINDIDKEDLINYIGDSNFDDFVTNKLEYASQNQQHFRPQNYWIPDGADFIGKYETFEKDIERLRSIIVMKDIPTPHENPTIYTHKYILNKSMKSIIYDIYKIDFDLFDYKP